MQLLFTQPWPKPYTSLFLSVLLSLTSNPESPYKRNSQGTRQKWPLEEWGDREFPERKSPPIWDPEILISHYHSSYPKKSSHYEPPCMPWSLSSLFCYGLGYPRLFKSLILLSQGAKPSIHRLFLPKPRVSSQDQMNSKGLAWEVTG